MSQSDATASANSTLYYRHTLAIRVMHWINVLAFSLLLMSGLQIFNAHPALYWGKSSYTGQPAVLQMGALQDTQGRLIGTTRIFGYSFTTTGVLGVSADADGRLRARGFPSWITVPGSQWLSMARRWHFFFAWLLVINGVAYLLYALASRHLTRDLAPTRRDWRSIGQSIVDHLRFRRHESRRRLRVGILHGQESKASPESSFHRRRCWICRHRFDVRCSRVRLASFSRRSRQQQQHDTKLFDEK